MGKKKTDLILLSILCFALVSIGNLKIVRATSIDYIRFSSGVTIFSPLNTTYNSRFLNLNMTFDQGAGIACSLNYSIDGNNRGSIPLVTEDTGFHTKFKKTGLVTLSELSEGSHYLTINVLCGLYDYHGAPPGAPFTPTFPGSSDYIATWTHTIYFKIDTSLPELPVSENWVEVDRFIGGSWNGGTRPFMINYGEWRIRWNYEPVIDIDEETPVLFRFLVLEVGNKQVEFVIGDEITNGTSMFFQQGGFYLFIMGYNVQNYTIIVEQNINCDSKSEGNWVGWSTFGGSTNFDGDPFLYNQTYDLTCHYVEWRINWEYVKDPSVITNFYFEIRTPETNEIISYYNNSENLDKTEGTNNIIGYEGELILFIETNTRRYFFQVEQNIDSIPEFPSWIILPLFIVAPLVVMIVRNRLSRKD